MSVNTCKYAQNIIKQNIGQSVLEVLLGRYISFQNVKLSNKTK